MSVDVHQELATLETMTLRELQARYARLFGHPTRGRHRGSLIRRILWRLQALAEGDLSQRARRRADELANDADLRLHPPRITRDRPSVDPAGKRRPAGARRHRTALPGPGTVLTRVYKGGLVEVTVLADGIDYGGARFATLSAVAKHVTGSHWNGFHFFGLSTKGKQP